MPGEAVGLAAAFCDGVAFGLAVGAGVGVATEAMILGGLLATTGFEPDFPEPFGSSVFAAAFRAVGDGLLTRLAGVLAEFDPVTGTRAVPGALKTTTRLFERCSICAVTPG